MELTALFWTLIILVAAVWITIAVRACLGWEPPSEARHTLDCLDWSTRGVRDPDCTAHHGTDWFSTAQDRVHLSNELDGQLWIQETK